MIVPGAGGRSSVSSASASIERAPSGTACHAGSGAVIGGRSATNVPRPGRASTSPWATSAATARWTVAGPARWRAINSRTLGSRAPGIAVATSASRLAMTVAVALSCCMTDVSNAIARPTITPADVSWPAFAWGALGVLAFSFSLPATRLAVHDLDPTFVGLGRALVAAVLAAILLAVRRGPPPDPRDPPRFSIVGVGGGVGVPPFTAAALHHLSSAHASVIVGMLPAATAAFAVLRAGERPPRAFWLAAAAGLVAVLVFAATQGVTGIDEWDLLVLGAVAGAALGYAEGGA